MSDDAFNRGVICISGCFRRRENQSRVEHVQTFVLHRTHVEIIHGDDVEQLQIVF